MANGVPLDDSLDARGSESFAAAPRGACQQQAGAERTADATQRLSERPETALSSYGRIRDQELGELPLPVASDRLSEGRRFTLDAFEPELGQILEDARQDGDASVHVFGGKPHRNMVGGPEPDRMPGACRAMRKPWRQQGGIPVYVIRTTPSDHSLVIEFAFLL
ncbi:MAG: hypothetical protein F4Y02_09310 [Chloroflexi bacterium]|nr:hypothetical protein [Chloroflexota bacterium]